MSDIQAAIDQYAEERKCAARTLRAETAQVLGLVLIEIAALRQVEDLTVVRDRLAELRSAVRVEIARIAQLADALERDYT